MKLSNSFHGTSVQCKYPNNDRRRFSLKVSQRIQKELCGVDGCSCGGATRDMQRDDNGNRFCIDDDCDGRLRISYDD